MGKTGWRYSPSLSPLSRSDVHHFCLCLWWWEIVTLSHLDAAALGERPLASGQLTHAGEEGILADACFPLPTNFIYSGIWIGYCLDILGTRHSVCHCVSDVGICFTTCHACWHRLLSRWGREWAYPGKRNLGLLRRGRRPVRPPCREKDALAPH